MENFIQQEINILKIISEIVQNSKIFREPDVLENYCTRDRYVDLTMLSDDSMINLYIESDIICMRANHVCREFKLSGVCQQQVRKICELMDLIKKLVKTLKEEYPPSTFCNKTLDITKIIKEIKEKKLLDNIDDFVLSASYFDTKNYILYFVMYVAIIILIIFAFYNVYKYYVLDSSTASLPFQSSPSNFTNPPKKSYKYPYFEDATQNEVYD